MPPSTQRLSRDLGRCPRLRASCRPISARFYDNLYRIDYSQLAGVTNLDLSYDAQGNITSKSDVGTYTYDATKKHQVTSTSNGWSFGYDNNGNMTSDHGATLTWTSYNYPASIANGSDTSSFSYTPNRQYWKQVSNYTSGGAATTIYVGGILEKVTTSAGTDYRHMIRAGSATIIVSRQSTGTNSVTYVTSDSIGSSSAVTNSSGGVLVNSSFDAFGKRRGSNWSGSPSSGDWTAIASTTRRGYTDQTMLDNLTLIHMNGRVQDPALGRFVSADPNIPGDTTQDFNRYSYVRNNPMTMTDPSGFAPGGFNHRHQMVDGDDTISPLAEIAWGRASMQGQIDWLGWDSPKVGNFTGMGWFQLTHMQGFLSPDGAIQPQVNPNAGQSQWVKGHKGSIELEDGSVPISGESDGHWEFVPSVSIPVLWSDGAVASTPGTPQRGVPGRPCGPTPEFEAKLKGGMFGELSFKPLGKYLGIHLTLDAASINIPAGQPNYLSQGGELEVDLLGKKFSVGAERTADSPSPGKPKWSAWNLDFGDGRFNVSQKDGLSMEYSVGLFLGVSVAGNKLENTLPDGDTPCVAPAR